MIYIPSTVYFKYVGGFLPPQTIALDCLASAQKTQNADKTVAQIRRLHPKSDHRQVSLAGLIAQRGVVR